MSGADQIEKLLDGVAKEQNGETSNKLNDKPADNRPSSRDSSTKESTYRNGNNGCNSNDDGRPMTSHSSGSRSERRQRSRSRDGYGSRRSRDGDDRPKSSGRGDYYRGNGRPRSRSRSPGRRYGGDRPRESRDYRDRRDRRDDRGDYHRDRGGDRRRRRRSTTPVRPTEEERDRRTVFVQQLAARLRTKELQAFFEKAGKVREATIVRDRISQRSKGLGYVEFENEESVQAALELTGKQLCGIPVIVQSSEAEKNRQQRADPAANGNVNGGMFHRLYIGNIHFNISAEDLRGIFEAFGELEFIQLNADENGRSKGFGFAQFKDPEAAKQALEHCNGMELAGRNIRVGLGTDKFPGDGSSTANKHSPAADAKHGGNYQGSSFSGAGGRGSRSNGLDRANARENERAAGGASALDDNDVAGGGLNNFNRNDLMMKLARVDDSSKDASKPLTARAEPKTMQITAPTATRSIVIKNMFTAQEEDAKDPTGKWVKELEEEVREELETSYGPVKHTHVDLTGSEGEIFARFVSIDSAEKAVRGLQGRFFAGRTLTCEYVVDAIYTHMYMRKPGAQD